MKTIVIAAGYATRLYPLTENFPKPLLKIGDSTILDRLLKDIDGIDDITEHIVVTNHKFAHIFEEWKETSSYTKPIAVVDDGTESNETRLGAVKDLLLAINENKIDDDILVIAADNVLDFSLRGFVEYAREKGTSCIMCHEEKDIKKLQKTGVITVDKEMKVLTMEEKPEIPKSNWAVPPFYIYRREDLPLIKDCMNHGCGFDAPGNLAKYLSTSITLHAYEMLGKRYDIGTLDAYDGVKNILI